MNKYMQGGIALAMVKGERIAVVTSEPRDTLEAIREQLPPDAIKRVAFLNGGERIDMLDGGRVTFHRRALGIRGMTADAVIVDEGCRNRMNPDEAIAVVASTGGAVIYA